MKRLLLIGALALTTTVFAQPANDEPCNATTLTAGTSCSFTQYNNTGATATTGVTAPGCANYQGADVWFKIVVPATGGLVVDTQTGNITDSGMAFYTGSCTALTLLECDDDDSDNGTMSKITRTGLVPGSTVWVRFWEYGGNLFGTYSICAQVYTPPAVPSNDNCTNAVLITQAATCSNTSGTTGGATASTNPTGGCGGNPTDDVWYRFVATTAGATVTLSGITGTSTDMYFAVYGGNCTTLSAPLICSDPNTQTFAGLTIGQTYYVRVYTFGANANNTNFNLCVTQYIPPPPPANDECANAITVASSAGCNNLAGSTGGATGSSQVTGCGGNANDDVWYRFTATSPGAIVSLSSVTGTSTDMYFAVYGGTCGNLGTPLVCSDPNSNTVPSLTLGNTYYIRVYTSNTTQNNTSFNLCVSESTVCGTPATQDYCMAPAILSEDPASTFTANTSGSYTSDTPANLNNAFCGSIENNSWYIFTATATTHVFNFTSVSNCGTSTAGIQAQVFNVTTNASNCCTNFASVSNCWNPGNISTGVVTASNLIVGNQYYLMVDGNAGAICTFIVSGWGAVGIIPLGDLLTELTGTVLAEENILRWSTKYESEVSHFEIFKRSHITEKYESIGIVPSLGVGYDVSSFNYQFKDDDLTYGDAYYQVKVFSKNGESNEGKFLHLNRSSKKTGILDLYPNPTNGEVNVIIQTLTERGALEIYDSRGVVVFNKTIEDEGLSNQKIALNHLSAGMYIVRLIDGNGKTYIKNLILN